ncbi:unnamed protein product [Schistosoma margrebowiei]|uniref:Uncharacterized protein n=1 Tax=Schistosoma margrebowiei TaxID=48269 RepID=A0A183MX23_9TREM|nr:unnamed protein product [Schistosoma margrebowiei]
MEKAVRGGNIKRLYEAMKKLRYKWVEHSEELSNRPASLNPSDIKAAPTDLPVDVTPPMVEEIGMAIRQIESGKASELDNIPPEL